jgi:hypothetical protein
VGVRHGADPPPEVACPGYPAIPQASAASVPALKKITGKFVIKYTLNKYFMYI